MRKLELINLLRGTLSKVAAPVVNGAVYRARRRGIIIGVAAVAGLGLARAARSQPVYLANPVINDFVPAVDDPTNASGLNAPAITRGTVYAHMCAGVTIGAGQSTGTRQATATGLQNGLNYAQSNGKFWEIIPNTYEINTSTGLVVTNNNGFVYNLRWRGSTGGTLIKQFYAASTGAPVVQFGTTTGSALANNYDIYGMTLSYGADQTGLTSAVALLIGSMTQSRIGGVNAGGIGFTPYIAVAIVTAGGGFNYSNLYENWEMSSAQQDIAFFNPAGASGQLFTNIYLRGNTIAGFAVNMGQATNEWIFRQLNIEQTTANRFFNFSNSYGMRIEAMHLEQDTFSGNNPGWFTVGGDMSVTIDTMDVIDPHILAANLTGSPLMMQIFAGANVNFDIRNMTWICFSAGEIDSVVKAIIGAGGNIPTNGVWNVTIGNGLFEDSGGGNLAAHWQFDQHMPVSSSAFLVPTAWHGYTYGAYGSNVDGVSMAVAATYTHYGQYTRGFLVLPATGTFTITLADTMGASGTQKPLTGSVVAIERKVYTSGTVTIADGGAGTIVNTGAACTATGTVNCIFNGTAWVTYTPVT